MNFVNAGLPKLLMKSGDSIVNLEISGSKSALGIVYETDYREKSVQLKSGDIFVLFTDGIPEALNSERKFYGKKRLEQFIKDVDITGLSSKGIVDMILEDIKTFSGNIDQYDDMTIVITKVL